MNLPTVACEVLSTVISTISMPKEALRDCAHSLDQFLNSGGRLMVTLAGAMSTAEIGRSLDSADSCR